MLAVHRAKSWLYATLLLCGAGCHPASVVEPVPGYGPVAGAVSRLVVTEMAAKRIPAMSIALVDGDRIVWARGFGLASRITGAAASAETVYRVGSVSKLFTAMTIMRAVEDGRLDLDRPIHTYLPDFRPSGPRHEITLRQLLSHRSGLVREPPVGNYFDSQVPTLEETIASLNGVPLVYPPGSRTKYSNAAVSVAGYVLEKVEGIPFAAVVERDLLRPLKLSHTSFTMDRFLRGRLASAVMWTYDGREFRAPSFPLGTAPAGNLYSTVTDLGRFIVFLLNRGRGPNGRVLKEESLAEMWRPQFADSGAPSRFGLGFALSEFAGQKRIGHSGAIYGFSTQLSALPDAKLGVAVVANVDLTNSVVRRIGDYALSCLLARREGTELPSVSTTSAAGTEIARKLAGRYEREHEIINLQRRGHRLFLDRGTFLVEVRRQDDGRLIVDDRLWHGTVLEWKETPDGLTLKVGNDTFRPAPEKRPSDVPVLWRGLIGEYGWDYNTLYILEKNGKLHALIEWAFLYPLTPVSEDVFEFPKYGLYHGERLVFERTPSGVASIVTAAGVIFTRRRAHMADDDVFRIRPKVPVAVLRHRALAARPPAEEGTFRKPDLVELSAHIPSLRYDIRYATENNFMNAVFYRQARAFLQRPAAEALARVAEKLGKRGLGLHIYDAYRPWYVTKMFWDATPNELRQFVANPARGSRHNRGCAVDLTLYERSTGRPVTMTSGYDEFTERAFPYYPGGTSLQRWYRRILRNAMESEGFSVYKWEWWHFDYKDWREYPIMNDTFEKLST